MWHLPKTGHYWTHIGFRYLSLAVVKLAFKVVSPRAPIDTVEWEAQHMKQCDISATSRLIRLSRTTFLCRFDLSYTSANGRIIEIPVHGRKGQHALRKPSHFYHARLVDTETDVIFNAGLSINSSLWQLLPARKLLLCSR